MRNFIKLLVVFSLLQSCTCRKPPFPIDLEEVKEWMGPLQSEELIFTDNNANQKIIVKEYIESQEYYGGDECGTMNPLHIINYYSKLDNIEILQTNAYRYEVIFNSTIDEFSWGNELLRVSSTERIAFNSRIGLTISDTVVNYKDVTLLTIENTENNELINFEKLKFVEGFGIVSFVDKSNTSWELK